MLQLVSARSRTTPPPPPLLSTTPPSPHPSPVKSHVHWPSFLSRHDLSWQWDWSSSSLYTLQPRASSLSKCGKGAGTVGSCCLAANTTNNDDAAAASSSSAVVLALCDPTSNDKAQQWQLTPSGAYINQHNKLCLQDNHGAQQLLGQCNTSSVHQQWRIMDGYLYVMRVVDSVCILARRSLPPDVV